MRNIALLIAASVVATGCAARTAPRAPDGVLSGRERVDVMREYLGRLSPGSRVLAVTADGTRVAGILLAVDRDRIVVQPHGRLPEPSRALPIASLQRVEPQPSGNGSVVKAVVIGVVTGAAAFLTMLLVTLAVVD